MPDRSSAPSLARRQWRRATLRRRRRPPCSIGAATVSNSTSVLLDQRGAQSGEEVGGRALPRAPGYADLRTKRRKRAVLAVIGFDSEQPVRRAGGKSSR